MDKKLKMKWVKALESGRYKQTRTVLTDNYGYCCLGVLCRVAGVPKEKLRWESTLGDVHQGKLLPSASMGKLIDMNDGGSTFREIAAWIREHL